MGIGMGQERYEAALEAIRRYGEWASEHPDEAQQVLVDVGIYTPDGQLTAAYGGPGFEALL